MPNIITIIDRANVPRKGYWLHTKFSSEFHDFLVKQYKDVSYYDREFMVIISGILTVTAQILTTAALAGFQLSGEVGLVSHPLKRKNQSKRRNK